MHWLRYFRAFFVIVAAFGAAACGTRNTVEIPYSTLKQHIAKGDVRDVRMSATEVRALPTDSARQAGAPEMWVATPVPNDAIVPLLESKNITYQGIKSDESHIALILGIIAGLTFVVILGMSYKRMNPVKSMTALTRGRLRARDRKGRPSTGFDDGRRRGRSQGRARGNRQVPAQPVEVRVARRPRAKRRAARRTSGHGQDAARSRRRRRSRRAFFLRQRFRVHRGVRRRWRVPRAQAVRTGESEGARHRVHRRARRHRQEPLRIAQRRRHR